MAFLELTQEYLRSNSVVKQFIDSYDKFVDESIQRIVDAQGSIEPQVEGVSVKLGKVRVEKPMVVEADGSRRLFYPSEARARDLTYSAPVFLEMTHVINGVARKTEDVLIGELPVMVKSKLCYLRGKTRQELIELGEDPMDQGGYFIINGIEKSLMTLEDLAPNRIFVSVEKDKGVVQAKVFSTREGFRGRCTVDRNKEGRMSVTMPSYSKALELILVLHALGLDKEEKILDSFSSVLEARNDILLNIEQCPSRNKKEALETIGKRAAPGQPVDYQVKRAELLIDRYLLPHIGIDPSPSTRLSKAYFLCRMAERTILVAYKKRRPEDKDHYANKRLKISGKLMEELFRYAFQFLVKDIAYQIERASVRGRKLSLFVLVRPDALTERIKYSMATGNWVGGHTGVCQPLDRYNFISANAFIKRVTSPLAKKHPHYKARDLNGTHWGRLDPNETPEGPNCVAPETKILLNDYSAMSIADFEKHWFDKKIASCDWGKKKNTECGVVRYVKQRASEAFEVTTLETRRKIIATADHPFYSQAGKMALSELREGDKVAVLPVIPLDYEEVEEKIILSEDDVRRACPPKTDFDYAISELKRRGLLPLKNNDARMLVLARLIGHLFGDGTLSYSMKKHKSSVAIVFTGKPEDLNEVASDVEKLGFKAPKESNQTTISVLANGQKISGTTFRRCCYSKPLWILLRALGAPMGDQTIVEMHVPNWIKNGGKTVAKEFLAAYFGSEMTKPTVDKHDGKTFLQPAFSLNKASSALGNALDFVEEVKQLLSRFGVSVSCIKIVDGVERNRVATKKIKVLLSSVPENLIKLYGTIGFAYSPKKRMLSRFACEYLLTKKTMLDAGAMAREQVLATAIAAAVKANARELSEAFSVNARNHDVGNWLKNGNKEVRVSWKDFPKFKQWISEHAISEDGLVWETIGSIRKTSCPDARDVTTREDEHNFFANGFLTGNCGLVKNLALFCEVTTGTDEKKVENALKKLGVSLQLSKTSVYLNGRFVGFCSDGEKLVKELRELRRKAKLDNQVNVAFNPRTNEVFVNTDDGRARRPLIVVKHGKSAFNEELQKQLKEKKIGWNALVEKGVIEYLDAEEEENARVAIDEEELSNEHSHLEINPVGILGYASAQVPFPEYNMAPRVLMAAQHTKQSLGLYATNFNYRTDTRSHLLLYPQRPLVQTSVYDALGTFKRASGQNFVVAVLSYYGYNMNDAIVINKDSIERALGRSVFSRTYTAEERRYPGGQRDKFGVPEPFVQDFLGDEEAYAHLDEQGFVDPETPVGPNTVLVGKTSPPRFLKELTALDIQTEKRRESSLMTRSNEGGVVDYVLLTESIAGNRLVKVRVRRTAIPEIGDKFASRFGQKGVISLLVPHEDMPFTRDGVVPDLIINPHAIPSRMTAGHLLEMLAGKAACADGTVKDGTAFCGETQEDFEEVLSRHGFQKHGEEVLYDGKTGKRIHAKIFIGVIYYQRLHHLVSLKLHARSRGPVQMLTHQPTEGRAREGGLRLGEMERDCFIGFGAASLLKERMIESSDKTTELICGSCGAMAVFDKAKNRKYCPLCEGSNVFEVETSYAFKLLLDEMKSIGIFPKIKLKEKG